MRGDKRTSFSYFGVIIDRFHSEVFADISVVGERRGKVGVRFVNTLLARISKKHTFSVLVYLADADCWIVMEAFNIQFLGHGGRDKPP